MNEGDSLPRWLRYLLVIAALGGLCAFPALIFDYLSALRDEAASARVNANLEAQNGHLATESALSNERNLLLIEQLTTQARQEQIKEQLSTPRPADNSDYALTATALSHESARIQATQGAIEARQKQVEATQTAVAQSGPSFECTSGDFIPQPTGLHPPIGNSICIPAGRLGWISSDPARIEIPGVYDHALGSGFTFVLFGPVKLTLSGVQSNKVWLDASGDTGLVREFDGKSLNLVYRDGKVCESTVYSESGCP